MKESDNKKLYESDEVVGKYAANTTRVRSLNNPEKELIDRFDVKNKDVLVLGSGAGRVPANLLLYGNRVLGIDRSERMIEVANKNYPNEKFKDLSFALADATDLHNIPDESYDVVIFPMNSIDYIDEYKMREKAILEAAKKLKKGGILALSSHNKLAYLLSPKVKWADRSLKSFSGDYRYVKESVVGGGYIFKGNPKFVIESIKNLTHFSFQDFICDTRGKIDKLFAKRLGLAQFYFPYILYVFKKI